MQCRSKSSRVTGVMCTVKLALEGPLRLGKGHYPHVFYKIQFELVQLVPFRKGFCFTVQGVANPLIDVHNVRKRKITFV